MEIVDLIQSVGFPIVAYLLMFGLVKGQLKANTEALDKLKSAIDSLKAELKRR